MDQKANMEEKTSDSTVEKLRMEAAQQRARVAADVERLEAKASPRNMKLEAKQALKEKGQETIESVREGVGEAAAAGRRAGSRVVEVVRDNPVPIAMIGVGLGMLLYSSRRRQSAGPSGAEVKARRMAHRAGQLSADMRANVREQSQQFKEAASEWGETAADYSRRAGREAVSLYEQNPLSVAAATVVAGAAVGMLLPPTKREDAVLGPERDALVAKVKTYAEQGLDAAEAQAQHAMSAAADRASSQIAGQS